MINNLDLLQKANNLLFSQEQKESDDLNYQYFSDDKQSNMDRNDLRRTYEMSLPKLIISNHLKNKDNNIDMTSSQNDINNQKKTFSVKNYSLNQNNSLLNEQQSYSQIMQDNINNSSQNNKMGNVDKMSISELYDNNENSNNKYTRNIYTNEKNYNKNNFSENDYINNKNFFIDMADDENINVNMNLKNKDNNSSKYNNNIDDDNDNEENYNEEEIENIDDNNEENESIEEDNKNKNLEEFLFYNENKNKKSQKENNYILFGSNNSNELINYNKKNQNPNNIRNDKKLEEKKRNFFSKIIDIEILIDSSEVYTKPWSKMINNIYTHLEQSNDSIQLISLGAQHTLCLSNQGKLFSFGWNNYSQCGIKNKNKNNINFQINKIEEVNEIKFGQKICDMSTGEDHSLIVTESGRIYGFGLNNNGQLCYNPKKHKVISKPSLIKNFRRNFMLNVQCTNNISFMLNEKKEAFICPWEDQRNNINYIPIKLFFPYKAKISMISCGDNFSLFLSKIGNVYSMGSKNKYGQLGHGDTNIILSPKMIPFFKNNKIKITQISCGYSHCLALDDRCVAFSWGFGGLGQLGQNFGIEINYIPGTIDFFIKKNIAIYQVSAGYHNSYFLTNKNEVYMCGTNGKEIIKEFCPRKIEIKNKYKDIENIPIWICRILNCWNRSMSVFYTIFLDCDFIDKDDEKVKNVLDLISKRWLSQSFSSDILKGFDDL